jgi:hypothetical protein
MKIKRATVILLALVLSLILFTACTDPCKWLFCNNNSGLFSDYCKDHKEYGEALDKAADDVRGVVDSIFG